MAPKSGQANYWGIMWGKWKNILTKEQDKYFISVASKEMIQLGYF